MAIFKDCINAGLTAMESVAGETVMYRVGPAAAVEITGAIAERTNQDERNATQSAMRTTHRMQWWRIRASKLASPPQHNATITRSDGTVYQIKNPDGPVWEWAEGQNTHYRICTIEIKP